MQRAVVAFAVIAILAAPHLQREKASPEDDARAAASWSSAPILAPGDARASGIVGAFLHAELADGPASHGPEPPPLSPTHQAFEGAVSGGGSGFPVAPPGPAAGSGDPEVAENDAVRDDVGPPSAGTAEEEQAHQDASDTADDASAGPSGPPASPDGATVPPGDAPEAPSEDATDDAAPHEEGASASAACGGWTLLVLCVPSDGGALSPLPPLLA